MGLPTALFATLFALLGECFHSISVLTTNFQAAPDKSLHSLNHLTEIFFKTSIFSLLLIHHPPFCGIYVSCIYPFSPIFISSCAFVPAAGTMALFPTSPHVAHWKVPPITDSCSARSPSTNNHFVLAMAQHHCLLTWNTPLGLFHSHKKHRTSAEITQAHAALSFLWGVLQPHLIC